MRWYRVGLLVVVSLTASAISVSAECAWVLWHGVGQRPAWSRLDVFDTRAACVRQLDKKQSEVGRLARRSSETDLWVVIENVSYQDACLPDTMNPHEARQ
jgi:hypothetical protein